MEKKLKVKLRAIKEGKTKGVIMDYLPNFSNILERANNLLPNNEPNKTLQLTDEKSNKIICSQDDYENLASIYNNGETIKLFLNIMEKDNSSSKTVKHDTIKEIVKDNNIHIKEVSKDNNNTKKLFRESNNSKGMINDKYNYKGEVKENKIQDNLIEREKIINDIRFCVKNKIKEVEPSLCQAIYESVKNQLKEEISSNIKNNNIISKTNEVIHKNIKCNNCNNNCDIKGVRYKCSKCDNYNLCSKCEALNVHDFNHILIKIQIPIIVENELNSKIKNLNYKNSNFNYKISIQDKSINLNKCTLIVLLENIGDDIKSGWSFKWLEGSEIHGSDYKDTNKIDIKKAGSTIIELVFEEGNIKKELREYNVYYQLINSDGEALCNTINFKVHF